MWSNRVARMALTVSCGVVAAATVAAMVAMGTTSALTRSSADSSPSVGCAPSPDDTTSVRGADGDMAVTVRVPGIAVLRVNRDGRVTAAMTNTGCAPQAGDEVYVFLPDGTMSECTSIDVGAMVWSGDFSQPGAYQPQRSDVMLLSATSGQTGGTGCGV